jgi:hypothetical protein
LFVTTTSGPGVKVLSQYGNAGCLNCFSLPPLPQTLTSLLGGNGDIATGTINSAYMQVTVNNNGGTTYVAVDSFRVEVIYAGNAISYYGSGSFISCP